MKQIIYIISLAFFFSLSHLTAHAVTEKEMDQARAIAAKAYLRYANDGSGYLDQVKASTMAELEKNLKPKEKENLKAFKSIPIPSDYQTWDKQKLVEYWGVKAFTTPGLLEKGRIGRNRAKKNISAMTVTPPAKETPNPQAETKPVESSTSSAQAAPAPSNTPTNTTPADTKPLSEESAPADSTAIKALAQAEAAADALSSLEDEAQIKKADNHTWIYIVILCVLVAVVCALVVFASNVMKKNEKAAMKKDQNPSSSSDSNANAIREKFTSALDAKNDEIKVLSKKIENLNEQNAALKGNLERLTTEAASLRSRLTDAQRKIADMQNAANAAAANLVASVQQIPQQQAMHKPEAHTTIPIQGLPQQPQPQAPPANILRTIYLGKANAKGIFIRADRTLNPGNSIYRLDTTDGYAGSFRVAADPTVWEMALLTPRESLSNACAIADIDNTAGMTKIINDSAGTAVFEEGRWKVIRKAKVHYE